MVAVLVLPPLLGLFLRELRSVGALVIAAWWQPLAMPYSTTFMNGRRMAHPEMFAVLQWTIVTIGFAILCRRMRAWQQIVVAIATMVGVGVLSHLAITAFGFGFVLDAP